MIDVAFVFKKSSSHMQQHPPHVLITVVLICRRNESPRCITGIIYQGISLLLITHLFYEQTLMSTKVGHVKSVPR